MDTYRDHLDKIISLNKHWKSFDSIVEENSCVARPPTDDNIVEENVTVTPRFWNNQFCQKTRTAVLRFLDNSKYAFKASWKLFIRNDGSTTTSAFNFEPVLA